MPFSPLRLLLTLPLLGLVNSVYAGTFSVADSRAQALGGTSVALGNVQQGFFYNPALMALHDRDEDDHSDGRYSFVLLLDALSDGAKTAAEAIDDDLEGQLSSAIDQLNQSTTPESAGQAMLAVEELGEAMRKLTDESIYTNLYTGFSISEPGDGEGGAFFVGSYVVGAGEANIDQADLDLLDDYLEALSFIESGGSDGSPHPELLDADGNFIDPSEDILSSADGAALVITEIGVSAAKAVPLWGQDFRFGLSPKMVYLKSFNKQWGVEEGDFDNQSDREHHLYLNFDLGMLWRYREQWRVGLSIRDAIAKTWTTSLGQRFELRPRPQLGLAYWGEQWRVGFDIDLDKRQLLQRGVGAREASLGVEWQALPNLSLRLGYRRDLENTLGDNVTGGIGWRWSQVAFEASFASGDYDRGASLQISIYQ